MQNFVAFLAEQYNTDKRMPAFIQEEYLTAEGTVDWPYVSITLQDRVSAARGNALANSTMGVCKFVRTTNLNEVTLEEFTKHYEFGTFSNVRGWIGLIYAKTGMLLTREALFKHLDKLRPQYRKVDILVNEF